MGVCVCVFLCVSTQDASAQIPDYTSSWADLEFRGFKALSNDRVGDGLCAVLAQTHTHTHTHSQIDTQMYAHMLTSLLDAYAHAVDTNTYFPLCYLRIPVIVHMQCRLSKHVEQKTQTGGGGFCLISTNKKKPLLSLIRIPWANQWQVTSFSKSKLYPLFFLNWANWQEKQG